MGNIQQTQKCLYQRWDIPHDEDHQESILQNIEKTFVVPFQTLREGFLAEPR